MNSIWALPGFLGLPSDWDFLGLFQVKSFNLNAFPMHTLSDWAHQFNNFIQSKEKKSSILLGYSLGGRLALHALIERPQLWQAGIIISAHPGLNLETAVGRGCRTQDFNSECVETRGGLPDLGMPPLVSTHSESKDCIRHPLPTAVSRLNDSREKESRKHHDREWAERFEKEEWQSLMKAWNKQKVFSQNGFQFIRHEENYQRMELANQLIQGSLGLQENLRPDLAKLQIPLLWITGAEDLRFCEAAQDLSFLHPHSTKVSVLGAGHRVPWEKPQVFIELVQAFLRRLTST